MEDPVLPHSVITSTLLLDPVWDFCISPLWSKHLVNFGFTTNLQRPAPSKNVTKDDSNNTFLGSIQQEENCPIGSRFCRIWLRWRQRGIDCDIPTVSQCCRSRLPRLYGTSQQTPSHRSMRFYDPYELTNRLLEQTTLASRRTHVFVLLCWGGRSQPSFQIRCCASRAPNAAPKAKRVYF